MVVKHTNRKGQGYYLHQGTTKTGKPKYYFSMKQEGELINTIPDGFEIYENPNAQVFLRKILPKFISDEEVALVEGGMEKFSAVKTFKIDVKKNILSIYLPDQDIEELYQIASPASVLGKKSLLDVLARTITYSEMLRFVLVDEQKRIFNAQRYCFLGSVDDWIDIGKSGLLSGLVETYLKHLGQESYFELFRWNV
jgi:hypothetical protein